MFSRSTAWDNSVSAEGGWYSKGSSGYSVTRPKNLDFKKRRALQLQF